MPEPNVIYGKITQNNAAKVHAGLETPAQAEQRSEHNDLNTPVSLTSLIPRGTKGVRIPKPVQESESQNRMFQ